MDFWAKMDFWALQQQKDKAKEESTAPQPSPEKRKSSSLRQLEGLQVGKKRQQHEFQGIQLKRVPKEKKEEKKEELERPDLKHRGSQAKAPSIPREEVETIRKDSLHPDRAQAREATELDEYQRRASLRVSGGILFLFFFKFSHNFT